LKGLPRVRSGLSREENTFANWEDRVSEIIDDGLFDAIYDEHERDVWDCIGKALTALKKSKVYARMWTSAGLVS